MLRLSKREDLLVKRREQAHSRKTQLNVVEQFLFDLTEQIDYFSPFILETRFREDFRIEGERTNTPAEERILRKERIELREVRIRDAREE